jgi:hypothetical protein
MTVCWQCGGVDHFKRNCRQWYPLKHSPEESQPRNGGGDNFNTRASSLSSQRFRKAWSWQSTHQGMDMRESRSSDRRHGASVIIVGPDITTGLPEREMPMRYALQTASGGHTPILKGNFHETDSAVAPTNNLSVHRQYHISQTSSSWYPASSAPTMCPWIWGATCYDSAMRKRHCGALGREWVQPPAWRATAKQQRLGVNESRQCGWMDPWRWCIASQGWVPGPSIKLKYVGREHRSNPQWRCL